MPAKKAAPAPRTTARPKTVRWVLAHEPVTTFEAAARRFGERLDRSGAGLRTEVFSAADYGRRLSPREVIDKVVSGEIEMCQTYTSALARFDERLFALDLPFLFRDHEHAASALDGPTGDSLRGRLPERGLRGLGFTYSGGFRVVSARRPFVEASELQGLRVRTAESPVPEMFFRELGALPVPAPLSSINALARSGALDAAEITYPRYWDGEQPRHLPAVVETGHSLLLTMIVVNEKFYQGLSEAQREAFVGAACEAARIERATSIAEGAQVKERCPAHGVALAELSSREMARWRKAGQAVRRHFAPRFGEDLVRALAS